MLESATKGRPSSAQTHLKITQNTALLSSPPWWQMFKDTTLNEQISRATSASPSIEQARQRLKAARALAHSTVAGFRPNAGLAGLAQAGTAKGVKDDISRRPVQLNLELGWDVALFGEDKLAQRSADLSAEMAATDLEAAQLAIAAEVASRYMHLRALQQRRLDAAALAELWSKTHRLANAKVRAGLETGMEAEIMGAMPLAAQQEKQRLDNAIADVIQQLAVLQGTTTTDPALSIVGAQPVLSTLAATQRPADGLRLRPDVRRAELAVLQAGVDLGIAQADLYPKLRLSGMIGLGTPVSGSLFGLMGGPSLQLPIFDQGKRQDVVAARRAQLDETIAAYKQTVLVAYEEASSALRAVQTARQNSAQLRAAYQGAVHAQSAADSLLREGLMDASKSTARHIAAIDLHGQWIDSIESEAQAMIVLIKASGGMPPPAQPSPPAFTPQKRSR